MGDTPKIEESAADGIIAELRDGGALHSEGCFTLDREVARAATIRAGCTGCGHAQKRRKKSRARRACPR